VILAIETAARTMEHVALVWDEQRAAGVAAGERENVAAELTGEIKALLAEHGVKGEELEAIAVDCGPGSFTGIRIGIATARGLSDGWGIQVWGVSQFDAFAPAAGEGGRLLLIDAGYGRGVYYQIEKGWAIMRGFSPADKLMAVNEIAEGSGVVLGWREGVELDEARWRWLGGDVSITAADVGRAALRLKAAGKELAAEPLYLHTHAYVKSAAAGLVGMK